MCLLQALLATQQRIQQLVPGFRFNLGFSGKYFHHGTSEENLGDDMLLGKLFVLMDFQSIF
jgi:heparan sulfate N-deacetylase/N-sulfotransferase NDST2